ncbi:hypothetical protein AJ79_02410 [Helicocarpus griseus UAMH5409]|uniref:SprT-like domain-containing protein n=1 Tax=Helicocarpus griseus UAMH5409 TaxID=1447875 RepID=A0A2B7XUJ3_9EURO|nr:hypothetical protein AJ79_02410 [Helicocarpus griseus UAMH5409]
MPSNNCTCPTNPDGSSSSRGLRSTHQPANPAHGLTEALATKLAIDSLDGNKRIVFKEPCEVHWQPQSTPFDFFDILDRELFRGVLKNEVYLEWQDMPISHHGATIIAGVRDTRVTIQLNSALLKDQDSSKPPSIIGILIHHMVHAYFLVCCGFDDRNHHTKKYRLDHGLGYSTLLHKISEVFQPDGLGTVMPNYFNCVHFAREKTGPRLSSPGGPPPYGYSSCKYSHNNALSSDACRDHVSMLKQMKLDPKKVVTHPISHYLHTVNVEKFTPVLRSRYSLSLVDIIELHYSPFAVPVPRSKLKDCQSLLTQASRNREIVQVPAPSQEVFFAFYNYIFKGDYLPELPSSTSLGHSFFRTPTPQGPPLILEYRERDPPYLLTDIQVFILASKTGFKELLKRALHRLYSQTVTHNDPIAALEEIYNNKNGIKDEADKKKLRKWAKKFLSKSYSPRAGMSTTNMQILQRKQSWVERFAKLRRDSAEFTADCEEMERMLVLKILRGVDGNLGGNDGAWDDDREWERDQDLEQFNQLGLLDDFADGRRRFGRGFTNDDDDDEEEEEEEELARFFGITSSSLPDFLTNRNECGQGEFGKWLDLIVNASPLSPIQAQLLREHHPRLYKWYKRVMEEEKAKAREKEKEKERREEERRRREEEERSRREERERNSHVCESCGWNGNAPAHHGCHGGNGNFICGGCRYCDVHHNDPPAQVRNARFAEDVTRPFASGWDRNHWGWPHRYHH